MSLKLRFGLGAAMLGIATCVTALILWAGMDRVAERLDAALAAEARMARYATLSQQAATFLVVATEAIQTGRPTDIRMERIAPVAGQLAETFDLLQSDVQKAVSGAEVLGLDAQSRYGTQSLGLARMEATLASTLNGLGADTQDAARLRAHVDTFAASFDSLLSQAVNTEVLFRTDILNGIKALRARLATSAVAIAALSIALVALFQFGLVHPQLRRLDRLADASRQIGQADFAVALPDTRRDEIGQLYAETNRMASALSDRQSAVEAEWAQLNDTIAARTSELRAANAQLAQVDENRRRFFADVSHELRTPLTVILMEAQIGRAETGNPAFATIESRADRLNRRIDDLLRVARSDSGQLALDPQQTPLSGLIASVTEEIGAELDNAGMSLEIGTVQDLTIECDPNWIRQVLVSLIRNAIRHARSGGQVALNTAISGETIEIALIDNGPGIAETDQPRLFDRFTQAGGASGQGFGIGLALARWVVEAHGGAISLTSPLPRDEALGSAPGTKVALRLPLADG